MGLFNSKPKAAGSRPVKARVYLTKEDRKQINQLKPIERTIGYFVAAYALVAMTLITAYSKQGFTGQNAWRYPAGALCCVAMGLVLWKTNRWAAGVAAMATVYIYPWGKFVYFIFPALAFFAWINIRLLKDQRGLMATRAQEGNFGTNPIDRSRRNADTTATVDASGRTLPPASKRYTPPKTKKKK